MATRWAICGAGKIAKDFCIGLNSLPKSQHRVVAVAAKELDRATKFASEHGIPQSFGSYEELLRLKDIDIVYVSTIQPFHVEACLLFINGGKNVLCEKPMTMSLTGCRKVLTAAKEKNVFFLEGYWTRFFPAFRFIQEQIASGVLGDIRMIDASFCSPLVDDDRKTKWMLGGGALMDIGVYVILMASHFFKDKPVVVKAEATFSTEETGEPVDKNGVILLKYSSGHMASLSYSAESAKHASSANIRGTKGNIVIPDRFWCPTQLYLNGELKEFPLPDVGKDAEKYSYPNSQGLIYEAQCVRECLLKGLKECPQATLQDTENHAWILQEVMNQCGINYGDC